MDNDAHTLLVAIGACHGRMKEHTKDLRMRAGVSDVTHWTDLYTVDDFFRWEEFVDAELSDGKALSWRLELTVSREQIAVEADVRCIHDQGQDVVATIADCVYRTGQECATGILEIGRRLCSTIPAGA